LLVSSPIAAAGAFVFASPIAATPVSIPIFPTEITAILACSVLPIASAALPAAFEIIMPICHSISPSWDFILRNMAPDNLPILF